MTRWLLLYGAALAAAAFLLQWIEYQTAIRNYATELYVLLVAVLFTGLGIWVGYRLTSRGRSASFEKNTRALDALGISDREYEVLVLLAGGCSNKEIAEQLFISPNTVKTHLANLYGKLQVSRRTQAIHKAKALRLIR